MLVRSRLARRRQAGECEAWGISTWDPGPLLTVLHSGHTETLPVSDVLMTRGGLLVNAGTLHAADRLCALLRVDHARRWAMSPFGGNADTDLWDQANPHLFLSPGQQASSHQAAFRLAYELPAAHRVAVSTNSAQHLDELLHATMLGVDHAKIARYRQLLTTRQSGAGAGPDPATEIAVRSAARRQGDEPPASEAPSARGDHRS